MSADTSCHLLRSVGQIARILEPLATRNEIVMATLPATRGQVTARLLRADPSGQFIIIGAMSDPSANVALLALRRVTLVSRPGGRHIEFVASDPCEALHDGAPAIRLCYPEILTVQRRQNPRHDVPPTLELRCVADAGGMTPFDAKIRDIGLGGISVLFYSSEITLEPGTVLRGNRIEVPGADSLTVDLEVLYSEVVTLPDGSCARRSGFQFLNADEKVWKLVDAFGAR